LDAEGFGNACQKKLKRAISVYQGAAVEQDNPSQGLGQQRVLSLD
jgi:hypothetical protein